MRYAREFFRYARERHAIYLARRRGDPAPWTVDPILQQYKFTNVFRELDRTTVWFRENVRDRMRTDPNVLLATVVFRWFNRIEAGEAIFLQRSLSGATAWDEFLATGSGEPLRAALLAYCDKGPYSTGAYIIHTPEGYSKLDGIIWCLVEFYKRDWQEFTEALCLEDWTMEAACQYLEGSRFMGDFMAYEVACDLRWTRLLERAPDIMTWASPGRGARRGARRVLGHIDGEDRVTYYKPSTGKMRVKSLPAGESILLMRDLLARSQKKSNWPADWPAWEMREVEHTLCEFDKYERVRRGEGRPRGTFRP